MTKQATHDKRSYSETTKSQKNKEGTSGATAPVPNNETATLSGNISTQGKTWNKQNNKPEISDATEQSVLYNTLEQLILKQSEKFDQILQQMSSLISLITTLITKLT